jgi:hypothetical protein
MKAYSHPPEHRKPNFGKPKGAYGSARLRPPKRAFFLGYSVYASWNKSVGAATACEPVAKRVLPAFRDVPRYNNENAF